MYCLAEKVSFSEPVIDKVGAGENKQQAVNTGYQGYHSVKPAVYSFPEKGRPQGNQGYNEAHTKSIAYELQHTGSYTPDGYSTSNYNEENGQGAAQG